MTIYKTLSASLDWPTGLSPNLSTTTLITGNDTNSTEGSVLIPHFISSAISQQTPVILLSFTQTYNHYMHIMRKMGVNLTKHPIKFVNALTDPHTDLTSLPPATRPHFTLSHPDEFFQWLKDQPACVFIIDGLCSMLDQGHTTEEVLRFFCICQRIMEDQGSRLVVNIFADEFTEVLLRSLIRRCHYVFCFEGLSSGTSTDVSGQLTVVPGHRYCQLVSADDAKRWKSMLLHYKVSDTLVQFFSPGQSSIVL